MRYSMKVPLPKHPTVSKSMRMLKEKKKILEYGCVVIVEVVLMAGPNCVDTILLR
jgi:hypothetical protein